MTETTTKPELPAELNAIAAQGLLARLSGLTGSVYGYCTDTMRRVLSHMMRQGAIPQHVAFIMDGNRRYAKKMNVQTIQGHIQGFHKLEETLDWCMDLGVKVVTVYAFSIENFKRPAHEVEMLMDLLRSKFDEFCAEGDFIKRHEICVRVIGDLSLAPTDVRKAAERAMTMTEKHRKSVLNIAFPYTSRQEMAQAAAKALAKGETGEGAIDAHLYTADCPPVDLLIRTSGEIRLSDFLLWQCNKDTQIHFLPVFWPEFRFVDMVWTLVEYNLGRTRRLQEATAKEGRGTDGDS